MPLPQAPALTLVKEGTLDSTVVAPSNRADAGDTINYTLTADEPGNVTLTGVTIIDPKLGTLVCTPPQPATLAPGERARLHGQLHADPGRPRRRPVVEHGDRPTATQTPPTTATETVPLPQAPALTVVKQGVLDMTVVEPANRADVGDEVDYTLTATNVGNVTLNGVTVSRPEAGHARLHAAAARDAGAGRRDRLHGAPTR